MSESDNIFPQLDNYPFGKDVFPFEHLPKNLFESLSNVIQTPIIPPDLFDSFKTGDSFNIGSINIPDPFESLRLSGLSQIDVNEKEESLSLNSGQIEKGITIDSTDYDAISRINEDFESFLKTRSSSFIASLKMADFEDGMTNELSDEVTKYLAQNKYPTYSWLYSLYSQNQTDYEVISGLLRIIDLTIDTSESPYLLPIVKCGLNDPHIEAQESAIMVIERWRTKECLDALNTAHFSSKGIIEYANSVINELKGELANVN